jgi:hypothetical protein
MAQSLASPENLMLQGKYCLDSRNCGIQSMEIRCNYFSRRHRWVGNLHCISKWWAIPADRLKMVGSTSHQRTRNQSTCRWCGIECSPPGEYLPFSNEQLIDKKTIPLEISNHSSTIKRSGKKI